MSTRVHKGLLLIALGTSALGAPVVAQAPPELPPLPRLVLDAYAETSRRPIGLAYEAARAAAHDPAAVGRLATELHAWEQFDAAGQAYRRAQALDPGNVTWWYLGGLTEIARARPDQAALLFERALPLAGEETPLVTLRLADARAAAGRLEAAAEAYRQVVDVPACAALARYGLAVVAMRHGDDQAADEALTAALQYAPDFGPAHYARAQLARRRGDGDAARVALALHQRCAHCWPWPPDPWYARVSARREDAFAVLSRGVTAAERPSAEAASAAIALHEAALERPETRGQALLNLIELHGRQGDLEAARRRFDDVRRSPGFEADASRQFAAVLLANGRGEEAAQHFTTATSLAPRDAVAWRGLGLALETLGRPRDAATAYRTALEVAPDAHAAQFGLARLAILAGRIDEAITLLDDLRTPTRLETPGYLFALSAAYARGGRLAEASRTGTEALALARELGDVSLAATIERELRKLAPPR